MGDGNGNGMGDWTTALCMWKEGRNQFISDDKMIFGSNLTLVFQPLSSKRRSSKLKCTFDRVREDRSRAPGDDPR